LWENPPTWRPELSPGTPKSKYLYDECKPRLLTFFFAKKRKKGEGKQKKNLRKQNQETLCRNRKTPAFGNNEPEQKLSARRNDQSSRYPLPSTDNSVSLSVPLPLCEVLFYLSIVQAGTEASEV
jgi:hypothetical protein